MKKYILFTISLLIVVLTLACQNNKATHTNVFSENDSIFNDNNKFTIYQRFVNTSKSFINSEFKINKVNVSSNGDIFSSTKLDSLFRLSPDGYVDLSPPLDIDDLNIHFIELICWNSDDPMGEESPIYFNDIYPKRNNSYLLVLKKDNDRRILTDTLSLNGSSMEDPVFGVRYRDGNQGMVLGKLISSDYSLFLIITKKYIIDNFGKVIQQSLDKPIDYCPIPVDYRGEMDDDGYVKFSTRNLKIKDLSKEPFFSSITNPESSWTTNENLQKGINSEKEIYIGDISSRLQVNNMISSINILPDSETHALLFFSSIPGASDNFDFKTESFDFAKNIPIGEIQIIDENTIKFTWYGFYNIKTKERIHTENPFEEGVETTILKRHNNN